MTIHLRLILGSKTDHQRTHVLSNAAGCVIHRILDPESEGGLGLRRCQWFANSLNEPSKAAAKRLGFEQDGILRNHRVLGPGKTGANGKLSLSAGLVKAESVAGRKGDYREDCMSRDTFVGSITWQDWENGSKEHIDKLMARKS
jgi:RimJ/RimL family protein N-acetyltransferase